MRLCDVNILIYAARQDLPDHDRYKVWLEDLINGNEAFGCSDLIFSSFIRIVTNRVIFKDPTPLTDALLFVRTIRECSNAVTISPGNRHWSIFIELCQRTKAKGNLIPDTYFAALAIESGSEWISADRDYARFPGLRWRHPLDD